MKGTNSNTAQTTNNSPYLFPITTLRNTDNSSELDLIMNTASSTIREVHEICRKKETEILVWVLSDTDRNWDPEVPLSTLLAYAMCGYSLPI